MPKPISQPVASDLPLSALHDIHDSIFLALDIADNQCPPPDEAYDVLRDVNALIDRQPTATPASA